MLSYAINPPDAVLEQAPFLLESRPEPFNSRAASVELARPLGLPRDSRVEAVERNPDAGWLAPPEGASPLRRPTILVGAGELPAVLVAPVSAVRDVVAVPMLVGVMKRADEADVPPVTCVVDMGVVVALVED